MTSLNYRAPQASHQKPSDPNIAEKPFEACPFVTRFTRMSLSFLLRSESINTVTRLRFFTVMAKIIKYEHHLKLIL